MMRVNILQVRGMGRFLMKRAFAHKSPEGSHHTPGGCHSSEYSGSENQRKPIKRSLFDTHQVVENYKNGGYTSTQAVTAASTLVDLTDIMEQYLEEKIDTKLKEQKNTYDILNMQSKKEKDKSELYRFIATVFVSSFIASVSFILMMLFAILKFLSPENKEKLAAQITK